MKSIMRFFSIAALAAAVATMVGCTREEINNANSLTFTTTVQLPTGGKAISENGEKTFAVGDRIKLTVSDPYQEYLSEPLTATHISANGKAAEFTFNFLSAPTLPVGSDVETTYPGYDRNISINFQELGTLATLPTYDYATGISPITTEGELPTLTILENQYAILKLKILNSAFQDITSFINDLYININDQDIELTRGAGNYGTDPFYTHFADDTLIYVVVPPINNGDIVFTARIDGTGYSYTRTKTVTGKTLQAGHMYPVELYMEDPATVTWNTAIIDGTAENYNGINAPSGNWRGPSLGGIYWATRQPATWTGGVISNAGAGAVSFTSGLGQITSIEMTDFSVGEGSTLLDGWTQSGTTLTWSGESEYVSLVDGNTLTLTAGPSARIVFLVK